MATTKRFAARDATALPAPFQFQKAKQALMMFNQKFYAAVFLIPFTT